MSVPLCAACLAACHAAGEPDFPYHRAAGEPCGAADHHDPEPAMSRDLEQRIAALALEAKTAGDLVGAAVCLRALGYRVSKLGNIGDFTLTGKETDRVRALAPNKAAARREAEKMLKDGEG